MPKRTSPRPPDSSSTSGPTAARRCWGENAARRAQRSTKTCGTGETDLDAFSDPEEQFRHEVYLAWARRIPKEDKPDRPLCAYRLGDGFLGSLTSIDGIARRKVVDVTVEVLPDWPPTWTPVSSTRCA